MHGLHIRTVHPLPKVSALLIGQSGLFYKHSKSFQRLFIALHVINSKILNFQTVFSLSGINQKHSKSNRGYMKTL